MPTTQERIEQLQTLGFDQSWITDHDDIRVACSQCQAACINGIPCHETGCINTPHKCRECGTMHATRQEAVQCCAFDVEEAMEDMPEPFETE